MARGILSADIINTVSERYAREILTPDFGANLDPLLRARSESVFGILNGVDYDEFCPSRDPHIPRKYDAYSLEKRHENKRELQRAHGLSVDSGAPVFGMVCRLDDQKGLDLVASVLDDLVELDVQFVAMGLGDPSYENLIRRYAAAFPRNVVYRPTAEESAAREIYAGADFLLAPSKFEPCGLSPLIALRYGAVPIVRATGGMAETIIDHGSSPDCALGIVFEQPTPGALLGAIHRALDLYRREPEWSRLVARAMGADYSWEGPAAEYEKLYTRAIELSGSGSGRRARVS